MPGLESQNKCEQKQFIFSEVNGNHSNGEGKNNRCQRGQL